MTFKIDDKYVLYNERVIFEAPAHICSYLVNDFSNSVMIVYSGIDFKPKVEGYAIGLEPKVEDPALQKLINQNLLCLDKDGNLLWQVEPTSEYPHWFFNVFNRRGEIWAMSSERKEYKIDPRIGKILASELSI